MYTVKSVLECLHVIFPMKVPIIAKMNTLLYIIRVNFHMHGPPFQHETEKKLCKWLQLTRKHD